MCVCVDTLESEMHTFSFRNLNMCINTVIGRRRSIILLVVAVSHLEGPNQAKHTQRKTQQRLTFNTENEDFLAESQGKDQKSCKKHTRNACNGISK